MTGAKHDTAWWTPLHEVESEGVAAALINAGADPDIGYPLHFARSGGAVRILIEAGLDPDALDHLSGYTPLHTVQTGEAARALIEAGADPLYRRVETRVESRLDPRFLPFFKALAGDVTSDHTLNTYQYWHDHVKGWSRNLPLQSAVFSNRADVVRVLLETGAYDPDNKKHVYEPSLGTTVVHGAIWTNNFALIQMLINAGFDPNVPQLRHYGFLGTDNPFTFGFFYLLSESPFVKRGWTPLHHASFRGLTNSVQALLAAGATINVFDYQNKSPVHYSRTPQIQALLLGNEYPADLHLSSGTDTGSGDWQGRTPLHLAETEVAVKVLLADGANVHARDNKSQTPLHQAATEGVATALLAAGADPEARDWREQTPLHTAVNEGVARALLSVGADPNAGDRFGVRPLHRSATGGVATALLAAGADPNLTTVFEQTPIHWANSGGTVKVLVDAGFDPNQRPTYSGFSFGSPLHWAKTGEAVHALIEAGADPLRKARLEVDWESYDDVEAHHQVFLLALNGDFSLWSGRPVSTMPVLPLHFAIQNFGHSACYPSEFRWSEAGCGPKPDVVRALLETGAYDPGNGEHVYDVRSGHTALYIAADKNSAAILQLLIDAGFDPDARNLPDSSAQRTERFKQLPDSVLHESQFDKVGKAALHRAAQIGGAHSVRVLLAAGATVDALDWDGATPLHMASTRAVAELLIDAGANPHAVNAHGKTPLHNANTAGVVDALLHRGADPNAADDSGHTPLHSAATAEIVRLLLKAGADPNATAKLGHTPLHWIVSANDILEHNRLEIVEVLLEAGADPNATTDTKHTQSSMPLHIAAALGRPGVLRILLAHGATVDAKDASGVTPLIEALTYGWWSFHDQDQPDHWWYLQDVVMSVVLEMVELLLDAGADPNSTSAIFDNTPLSLAKQRLLRESNIQHRSAYRAVVKVLLEAGAYEGG